MKKTYVALLVGALFAAPPALAGERESMESLRSTTLGLINALVEQGVLTRDKAEVLVKSAEKSAAAAAKPEPATVRVPYVPEIVRNEIRDEIKKEVLAQAKTERWGDAGALPDWIGRIAWDGDLRLRYQLDRFPERNNIGQYLNINAINSKGGATLATVLDCTNRLFVGPNCAPPDDRERLRLRARIGMTAKISDAVSTGVRLTTTATTSVAGGSINDPVSSNQTLGNSFAKDTVAIDRAYVTVKPTSWLTLTGGRIANPWFATELVWAPDLSVDGAMLTVQPNPARLGKLGKYVTPWLSVGAFPLQELGGSGAADRNKWLYAAQVGADVQFAKRASGRFGLAYYHYQRIRGTPNSVPVSTNPSLGTQTDFSAPQFVQKGNSTFNLRASDPLGQTFVFGLAPDYHLLNLTGSLDLAAYGSTHVMLTGDYVKNIGYDRQEILARTGQDIEARTTGYYGKIMVGKPELANRGDWQLYFGYRYLERDAVLDAYTDTDFHLGGTDAKGYVIGGSYAFDKNASIGLRWLSANAIDGPPLAIDVGQVDVNVRF